MVRNPFTTLVSSFFYALKMCHPSSASSLLWVMLPVAISSKAYQCTKLSAMSLGTDFNISRQVFNEYVSQLRVTTQTSQLMDLNGSWIVNHIIRMEDAEYDQLTWSAGLLDLVCNRVRRPAHKSYRAVSSTHCSNVFRYYSEDMCAYVAEHVCLCRRSPPPRVGRCRGPAAAWFCRARL